MYLEREVLSQKLVLLIKSQLQLAPTFIVYSIIIKINYRKLSETKKISTLNTIRLLICNMGFSYMLCKKLISNVNSIK